MTYLKSKFFIGSIAIYIIIIKVFELLFSLNELVTVSNNLSNTLFYIFSTVCVVLSILLMKFLYLLFSKRVSILYFLIGIALLMILSSHFLNSRIGEIFGGSEFEFSKLITYQKIGGYSFFVLHILFLIFHKFLFRSREADNN